MNLIAQIDFNQLDQLTDPKGNYVAFPSLATTGGIVSTFLPYIFVIAGMLLLVYLIFGGLQLMLSRGDPKAAQGAKSHITNALVGFIIIFISYWVVQLFGLILGLQGIGTIFR